MYWTPPAVKVGRVRRLNPELLIIKDSNPKGGGMGKRSRRRFKPFPWEAGLKKKAKSGGKKFAPVAGGTVEEFSVYAPFPGVHLGKVRVPMKRVRRRNTRHPLTIRVKGSKRGISWKRFRKVKGRKAGGIWARAAKYHRGRRVKILGKNFPLRKKIGGRKLTWRQVVSKHGVKAGRSLWRRAGGYYHARNRGRSRSRNPLQGIFELSPAYGRDYKNSKEVIAAFKAGKDFDGDYQVGFKLVSIRDFAPGATVMLRYAKQRKVAVTHV